MSKRKIAFLDKNERYRSADYKYEGKYYRIQKDNFLYRYDKVSDVWIRCIGRHVLEKNTC